MLPELSALLGSQVPDLRGLFRRGHGRNSAALVVQQGDAMRDFYADFNSFSHASYHYDGAVTRSLHYGSAIKGEGNRSYVYAGWTLKPSLQVPTTKGNRPPNQAGRSRGPLRRPQARTWDYLRLWVQVLDFGGLFLREHVGISAASDIVQNNLPAVTGSS